MRIMGLDYGSKTVGVAISDALGLTAQGIEIIRRTQENKHNTIGDRAEKSLAFKEMLERRTGLDVFMWDERLTTVEANRTLIEGGVRRENRGKYVDKLAAIFILQGFLDSKEGKELFLRGEN